MITSIFCINQVTIVVSFQFFFNSLTLSSHVIARKTSKPTITMGENSQTTCSHLSNKIALGAPFLTLHIPVSFIYLVDIKEM